MSSDDMDNNSDLLEKLRQFLESEARSCSMDPGCITPEYVFRMWGGQVPLEDIKAGLEELKNNNVLCGGHI